MSADARELRNELELSQVVLRESRQRVVVPLAQVAAEVASAVTALEAELHALAVRREELQRLVVEERVESLARKLALATRNERAQWNAAFRLLSLIALVTAASLVGSHAVPELSRWWSLVLCLPAVGLLGRIAFVTGRSLRPQRTR